MPKNVDVRLIDTPHDSSLRRGSGSASSSSGSGGAPSPHELDGIHHTGTLAWASVNKTGSNLTDLATRAHSSLTGIGVADHHDLVTAGNTGLSVPASPSQVVSLNLATDPGLEISSGVRVKAYYGINRDSNGVGVKAKTTSGLEVDTNGVAVGAGDGIDVLTSTIAVDVTDIIDTNYGLYEPTSNNIGIKLLSGMTAMAVDANGLAIADAIAGAGLAINSTTKVIAVVAANTSITVNANDLNVNLAHAFNWTANHTWDTSVLVVNTSTDTVSVDTTLFVANAASDLVTIDTNLFYADAVNNRIGVNRTPGNAALDVIVTTNADHTLRVKQKSGQSGRLWRVEDTAGDELIVLDSQGNLQSGQPGFVSGLTGWQITPTGTAEFNNVWVRGELHATVFVKDEIHATGGTLIVATAGKLYSDADIDVTTLDSELLDIDSTVGSFGTDLDITTTVGGFGTNLYIEATLNWLEVEDPPSGPGFYFDTYDVVRSKTEVATGVTDFWLEINDARQMTGYSRYSVTKRSGTDGTLPAGSAVVSYGQPGDGRILLTSDLNYAPYQDVFTVGPNVWTGAAGAIVPHVRLGRLDGVGVTLVSGVEQYGLIAGTDLSNANSPYIVASNLQLALFKVDLTLNDGTNDTGQWTATGNLTVGTNVAVTAGKAFSVQTTGDDAGDVIVGDHTLAGNYLKWDKSAGTLTINGALSVGGTGVATVSYVDSEIVLVDAGAASYAATAQSTAISTAASDATTKANTAQSTAISTASSDATTKANTAQSTAISTASADATTKANTAQSTAISTAAADATAKANAAQAAAEATAQAYGNARRVVGISGTFTSTDADTITWTSVTVRFGDGTSKSITNSNTGNMAARTYLYVDATAASPLTMLTTTNIASIGANNALIAVCDPGTDKASVSIQAGSTYISGDNIITGSIVAANIKAGAITASEISAAVFTTINTYADNAANAAQAAAESTAQNYTDTINSYRALGVDGTFTSTDVDTITWTSVALRKANGANVTIINGSTSNMAARTWLYIESSAPSPATMQMQTSIGGIPANAIIVGVATPGVPTGSGGSGQASIILLPGRTMITGDQIVTGSIITSNIKAGAITATEIAAATITASKIAAGTITATQIAAGTITATELAVASVTAAKISVSSLSAVNTSTGSLSVTGSITVGSSGAIFSSGKTTFADSDAGFFLGWDTVTTSAYKFSIGDGNNYIRWDGTFLNVNANQPIFIEANASNQVLQFSQGGPSKYVTFDGAEIGFSLVDIRAVNIYGTKLINTGTTFNIAQERTIAASSDFGVQGDICYNNDYLFIYIGGSWRRIPMFSGGTYW